MAQVQPPGQPYVSPTQPLHPGAAPPQRPPRAPGWLTLVIVLSVGSVLLMVVAAVLVVAGPAPAPGGIAEDDRQAALQSARQSTLDLVTIDYRTAQRDIDEVLDGATGQFRDEFAGAGAQVRGAAERSRVESTGQVQEAGIERIDPASATVLVAAAGTVRNISTPEGEQRDYRIRVTLQKVNGQWLVSSVEFVQ